MIGERGGRQRRTLAFEIGGACHQMEAPKRDAAADQAGVEGAGDADRHVEALLHDVHRPVREVEDEIDLRMPFQESGEDGGQVPVAEFRRRGDAERALRALRSRDQVSSGPFGGILGTRCRKAPDFSLRDAHAHSPFGRACLAIWKERVAGNLQKQDRIASSGNRESNTLYIVNKIVRNTFLI